MSKHHASCPRPDLLIALDEGVLPEALSKTVRDHLNLCVTCTALRRDLMDGAFAEPTEAEVGRIRTRVLGRRWPAAKLLALAAGVILVASLYTWRSRPSASPVQRTPVTAERKAPPTYRVAVVAAPLRLPFSTAMVLRGKGESASQDYLKELGKALAPYRSAAYRDAAVQLGELRARYPKAVEAPFYQGVARLLSGDFKGSVEPLEAAESIGGEALNDDIAWYLAAARERNGQWEKATPLLESLCRTEGAHRAAACAALAQR